MSRLLPLRSASWRLIGSRLIQAVSVWNCSKFHAHFSQQANQEINLSARTTGPVSSTYKIQARVLSRGIKTNLIPCPGPHLIPEILTRKVPPFMAMQSSPLNFDTMHTTYYQIIYKIYPGKIKQDTFLTSFHFRVVNFNVGRSTYVNSIGIWTCYW